MLKLAIIALAATLASAQPTPTPPTATEFLTKDPEFKPLVQPNDLSGWVQVNCTPETFTVKDGVIHCTGTPTGILRSEQAYNNFILEVEWRHLNPKSNAGIFVWSEPLPIPGSPFTRSIEVQVMDGMWSDGSTSDGDVFPIQGATMIPQTGKFKGQKDRYALPEGKFTKPSPEWNHYRITCNNGEVTLAVNGHETTKGSEAMPAVGYICLESEGSPVEFRNLRLKELSSSPSQPPRPASDGKSNLRRLGIEPGDIPYYEHFDSLYNGLDFRGWKFTDKHKDHWTADNGKISYDGQPSDELWSEKSYKDFILICDWRWTAKPEVHNLPIILPSGEYQLGPDGKQATAPTPEAGDSGIYLRGSSKSQVNMWCWPIGSGEVYGYRTDPKMPAEVKAAVTPKMNADAPIGQWNRFVITMRGDLLTVVLNDKLVIENAKLPGVAAEGPIALQQHGSPIQFANIYIKELPPAPK